MRAGRSSEMVLNAIYKSVRPFLLNYLKSIPVSANQPLFNRLEQVNDKLNFIKILPLKQGF
jgi:hypothetical protein